MRSSDPENAVFAIENRVQPLIAASLESYCGVILAFIKLADLIINTDCIATVKFRTYSTVSREEDVPTVNICLMLHEGSVDGEEAPKAGRFETVEKLEFEGDLALIIWNYFVKSELVKVLFD